MAMAQEAKHRNEVTIAVVQNGAKLQCRAIMAPAALRTRPDGRRVALPGPPLTRRHAVRPVAEWGWLAQGAAAAVRARSLPAPLERGAAAAAAGVAKSCQESQQQWQRQRQRPQRAHRRKWEQWGLPWWAIGAAARRRRDAAGPDAPAHAARSGRGTTLPAPSRPRPPPQCQCPCGRLPPRRATAASSAWHPRWACVQAACACAQRQSLPRHPSRGTALPDAAPWHLSAARLPPAAPMRPWAVAGVARRRARAQGWRQQRLQHRRRLHPCAGAACCAYARTRAFVPGAAESARGERQARPCEPKAQRARRRQRWRRRQR